ncbi:MAG: chemotaxis protein CheR [Spirochaetaceae bacterium]|nr:MAG: chemotaxis protein CheR [Spirochaetaceae bacterium]
MQTQPGNSVESLAGRRIRNGRSDQSNEQDRVEHIDFKMVTFSLGGKDYGIDIMKVAEIAKFRTFTYVPNTPDFVRGVYNLRGDIISIIDLRKLFNLSHDEQAEGEAYDGLIIRLEENMLGVIVDSIARVVGISRNSIQPPHPIFADVNLKYIEGVVEYNDRLYIILDVERIFAREERKADEQPVFDDTRRTGVMQPTEQAVEEEHAQPVQAAPEATGADPALSFEFIRDTLSTFAGFHVTPVNETWVRQRYEEWSRDRKAENRDVQFESAEDAQAFLSPFYSPDTGRFWSQEYSRRVRSLLPDSQPTTFFVWNAGCAGGYESYSLASVLVSEYGDARIKIWAHDKNLMQVSSAPNLVFQANVLPPEFREYTVTGTNGSSFSSEIKDRIVFEYHNVLHSNSLPAVDMVLARDLLSFLDRSEQAVFLEHAAEKLKSGGIIVVGEHERLDDSSLFEAVQTEISGVYQLR